MDLDFLITKFREVKEELNKSFALHDTVEGFMTGLKALPKGSPARGQFITQHMNHGPFLGALNAHPQGKQVHSMLTNHLNSKANAGFRPGTTSFIAKDEDLDKGLFGSSAPTKKAFTPSFKGHKAALGVGSKTNASGVTTQTSHDPLKQITSSKKFIDIPFEKTINTSYSTAPNYALAASCDEKVSLSKNGQWELTKSEPPAPKFKTGDWVDHPNDPGHKLQVIGHKYNGLSKAYQYKVQVHQTHGGRYNKGGQALISEDSLAHTSPGKTHE